jgi:hypothetical protein
MNKIWLIIQREFLIRVQKRSFLIATILVPLIFPAIIGLLAYIAIKDEQSAKPKILYVLDESGKFVFENTARFSIVKEQAPLDVSRKRTILPCFTFPILTSINPKESLFIQKKTKASNGSVVWKR